MKPSVSVIVPTFQRPAALTACLRALSRLDYPRDRLEVIVVNDGGTLPPALTDGFPDLPLTVLHQRNAGPASARNAGAAGARGRILAFTDDDCEPAPDWLTRLVEAVAAEPACVAGGRTINAIEGNVFAAASQLMVDFLYEHYTDSDNAPRFFTSNNMALDVERFRALGGFDARFPRAAGEDRDFCDQWRHGGGTLRYVPDAVVHHSHDLTLRRFWRQHFGYGAGAVQFHRARARRAGDRIRVEPISFYWRLMTYPLRGSRTGLTAGPLVGLLVLSQVANVAGYLHERRRVARQEAP